MNLNHTNLELNNRSASYAVIASGSRSSLSLASANSTLSKLNDESPSGKRSSPFTSKNKI